MNKKDLIEHIQSIHPELSFYKTEKILNDILTTIKWNVADQEDVKIVGFGTFTHGFRKLRNGHNPQTGEKIKIEARYFPKFKPGADFKKMLHSSS